MRAAAIDLGKVRVGLAVSDPTGLLAHPRPFLRVSSAKKLVERLSHWVSEEAIEVLVLGLPRNMDGSEGLAAKGARRVAQELEAATGLAVHLVDERWTTVEARRRLQEQGLNEREIREKVDSASAALMLQAWLDSERVP